MHVSFTASRWLLSSSSVQRTHGMTDFFLLLIIFSLLCQGTLASVVRPCCWLGRESLSSDSCWHYRPGRGTQTCTGRSSTGAGATLVSAEPPDVGSSLLSHLKRDSARGREAGRLHQDALHLPFHMVTHLLAAAPSVAPLGPEGFSACFSSPPPPHPAYSSDIGAEPACLMPEFGRKWICL